MTLLTCVFLPPGLRFQYEIFTTPRKVIRTRCQQPHSAEGPSSARSLPRARGRSTGSGKKGQGTQHGGHRLPGPGVGGQVGAERVQNEGRRDGDIPERPRVSLAVRPGLRPLRTTLIHTPSRSERCHRSPRRTLGTELPNEALTCEESLSVFLQQYGTVPTALAALSSRGPTW